MKGLLCWRSFDSSTTQLCARWFLLLLKLQIIGFFLYESLSFKGFAPLFFRGSTSILSSPRLIPFASSSIVHAQHTHLCRAVKGSASEKFLHKQFEPWKPPVNAFCACSSSDLPSVAKDEEEHSTSLPCLMKLPLRWRKSSHQLPSRTRLHLHQLLYAPKCLQLCSVSGYLQPQKRKKKEGCFSLAALEELHPLHIQETQSSERLELRHKYGRSSFFDPFGWQKAFFSLYSPLRPPSLPCMRSSLQLLKSNHTICMRGSGALRACSLRGTEGLSSETRVGSESWWRTAKKKDDRVRISALLKLQSFNDLHRVCGWVKSVRRAAKDCVLFLQLNDGSSPQSLQIVVTDSFPGFSALKQCVCTGCSMEVVGTLKRSRGRGQLMELLVSSRDEGHEAVVLGAVHAEFRGENENLSEGVKGGFWVEKDEEEGNRKDAFLAVSQQEEGGKGGFLQESHQEDEKGEGISYLEEDGAILVEDKGKSYEKVGGISDENNGISDLDYLPSKLRDLEPSLWQKQPEKSSKNDKSGSLTGRSYPLSKKWHSCEFLRTFPHLRSRTSLMSSIARIRSKLFLFLHQFLQERGFLLCSTPIITTMDAEGAGKRFLISEEVEEGEAVRSECDAEALRSCSESTKPFRSYFKELAYLTVSGQLALESQCCGLGDVYTLGPTFRAENSNTRRHLAEFWMLEVELAFANLPKTMSFVEDLLKECISWSLLHCKEDLEIINSIASTSSSLSSSSSSPPSSSPSQNSRKFPSASYKSFAKHENPVESLEKLASSNFVRIPYTEAIRLLQSKKEDLSPLKWGEDLSVEHEKLLTDELFKGPVIVYDHPAHIKPFYMRLKDGSEGKVVSSLDVLLPGIGEVAGGSQREERLEILDRNLRRTFAKDESSSRNLLMAYDWYRDLRRYGTIPHSGFGIGVDRLLMLITGMENIRDVVPFPRYAGHSAM